MAVFAPPSASQAVFDMGRFARGVDVDDTAGFQACYSEAAAYSIANDVGVVVQWRPGRKYRLTDRVVVEGAIKGITTLGMGSTLNIDEAVGHGRPAMHFGYDVATTVTGITLAYDPALGRVATTTATADISRTSRIVQVASTTGMEAGMALTINSDNEYFLGITNDSGFHPRSKSELSVIRSVDSSTQLTLDHLPEDDYSTSGYTVSVGAYRRIKEIHFQDVIMVGAGQGGDHPDASWGPEGIRVEWAENFSFTRGRMQNFGQCPLRSYMSWGVRLHENFIFGEDMSDATNQPGGSDWFYGPSHQGSCHTSFVGNTVVKVRRPEDHGPVGVTSIGRHILQGWNRVVGAGSGMGAHMCSDVLNIGNEVTDASNGHYYRAKNVRIIGGFIRTTGTGAASCAVSFGSYPGYAYTEDPNLGNLLVDGLQADTAGGFLLVSNSVDSLTVTGCSTSDRMSQPFLKTQAKQIKRLKFQGNSGVMGARAGNGQYSIHITNDTDNPMTVLEDVEIEGNHVRDGRIAVYIDGTNDSATPAKRIKVRRNAFPPETAGAINGPQYLIRMGASGWYDGSAIELGPNDHDATASTRAVDLGDLYRWTQMPLRDKDRSIVGTATSAALASPSWGSSSAKTTLIAGMRIVNSSPAAGAYSEWIVTSSGTMGTITVGTTGSITSGSTTLTVNANDDFRLFPGARITIAGAGVASANLSTYVTAVSGTTITVANAASTSVTDAAISYTAPTIKGVGLIES